MANAATETPYAMPKIGDVVAGKYRLERVAGEGGMGIVYAAEHLVLRQRVAVKVLLPDAATSDAVVERFEREAQAAARIQSEHVARVMDAGSLASGAPFLVMEFLEGSDFEELLEQHTTLPVADVADAILQALEALAHAHSVGIVHRDLKPANLFLASRPDGRRVVKMLDFGISKTMQARPGEKVLTGHAVLGSPVYMSPEQLRNAKKIDGRADIWSLGVVAYELLTGKPPFDGDGVGEIFAAILEKQAIPVHVRNPEVPVELSNIIAKCLARKVSDRWSDPYALARAVEPFGSGAFAHLVERIEQVLSRAKMFRSLATPTETRLVVDAIAAAARRARTQAGVHSAIPPSTRSPLIVDVELSPEESEMFRPASRRWLKVGAIVLVVAGAGAAFGIASQADFGRALDSAKATSTPHGSSVPPPEAQDPPSPAQTTAAQPQPTSPRSRASKPTKPQRPKFLNSRE